jgi:hypothetical protein
MEASGNLRGAPSASYSALEDQFNVGWVGHFCDARSKCRCTRSQVKWSFFRLFWMNQEGVKFQDGSVIGCYLDINANMHSFFHNGIEISVPSDAMKKIRIPENITHITPFVEVATSNIAFTINLGGQPFQHPPARGYKPVWSDIVERRKGLYEATKVEDVAKSMRHGVNDVSRE